MRATSWRGERGFRVVQGEREGLGVVLILPCDRGMADSMASTAWMAARTARLCFGGRFKTRPSRAGPDTL